jgi:glucose-1-phosphate thymidylyltransferase
MKALIAAGGRATRLRPITWTLNKHLIPLANKPMLWHVIDKITEAGIKDIIINVNIGEVEVMRNAFGDGEHWGAKITYLEQKGGAQGVAHVVANAEEHLKGEKFLFFLGDNIILGSIKKFVDRFLEEDLDCMIALSRVKDPERFGVPEFHEDGTLKQTVEKPENPPSPFAVTGIYLFDQQYFEAFKTVEPSGRGEYEITDVITWYIKNGKAGYEEITGWWKDTGCVEALLEGNALTMDDTDKSKYIQESKFHKEAQVQGPVKIGKNVKISKDCLIRGPVAIGDNCVIEGAYIGPYTSIGKDCVIKNSEVEHSILFPGVVVDTHKRIVDSVLGENAIIRDRYQTHPRTGSRMVVGGNSYVEL